LVHVDAGAFECVEKRRELGGPVSVGVVLTDRRRAIAPGYVVAV